MLVEYLKSKIHGATITQSNLHYKGSITIDSSLLAAANMQPNEKVCVCNFQNGNRLETYIIKGKAKSGTIGLNGPAALLGEIGQQVVIFSYALMTPQEARKFKPKVVFLDKKNRISG
jgi:aspartate 1-decarboxylase